MPKDKILLDTTETEHTELDDKNNIISIEAHGVLKVMNSSSENRLWNLMLKNKNTREAVSVDLPIDATKESVEPGKSWDFNYKLSGLKEPILKLSEIFDTSKNAEGVNHNFVLRGGDPSEITFKLLNVSGKAIQNIVLTKQLPAYLKDLKVSSSTGGNTDLDLGTKLFKWSIPSIDSQSKAVAVIVARAELDTSDVKSGNPVEVTYESDMNLRSSTVSSIEGLTDTMTSIDQEEDDSKPGWWNCTVGFDNDSDFEVTVKALKVAKKVGGSEQTLVDIAPNQWVAAKGKWNHKFSVESPSVPSLTQKLAFTANYTVPTKIFGSIKQAPKTFPVLETTITKNINPPEVNANANTDMTITNTIINKGTANIDSMELKDVIPKDFEAPGVEKISLTIVNSKGDKVATLSKDNAPIEIIPENQDTKVARTILIHLKELNDMWKSGSKLVMQYPMIARNPQPNMPYETPIEIISFTKPKGPGFADKPVQMPAVGIKYVKRKVKTGKSISPAGKEGAFNVVIKISNEGGVELENISLVEEVAAGFKVSDFKPENIKPEYQEGVGNPKLVWKIARLNPGESVKFQYISEGQGEYPRTEPEVIIAESDSMKKEKAPAPVTGAGVSVQDKAFKDKNVAVVNDIFDVTIAKLNKIVRAEDAAKLLDATKDQLISKGKSSPILHEIGLEVRELAKLGPKMLVGTSLDGVLAKIREWKTRLIS